MGTRAIVIGSIVAGAIIVGAAGFWFTSHSEMPVAESQRIAQPSHAASQPVPAAMPSAMMPPGGAEMRENMKEIQALPPEERAAAMQKFRQKMMEQRGLGTPVGADTRSPASAEMRQRLQEIQALPPEERAAAMQKFRQEMMAQRGLGSPLGTDMRSPASTEMREKLQEIQALPPEERAEAMQKFRQEMMQQKGMMRPTPQPEDSKDAQGAPVR